MPLLANLHRPLPAVDPATPSKVAKIWTFIYECIIKEFLSCLRFAWYRILFKKHDFGLNPSVVLAVNNRAKVILLLHGAGSHRSSFYPLAQKLAKNGIQNVYTVPIQQTNHDPVPTAKLNARINKIAEKCEGINVEYCIIGHSLGALSASKFIWRENNSHNVSMMISIAGRLKYLPAKTNHLWFCEEVVGEIDLTAREMEDNLHKTKLYTIWGDHDAFVPRESAHMQENPDNEYTVTNCGHGGIIFAPASHAKIIAWIEDWLKL